MDTEGLTVTFRHQFSLVGIEQVSGSPFGSKSDNSYNWHPKNVYKNIVQLHQVEIRINWLLKIVLTKNVK